MATNNFANPKNASKYYVVLTGDADEWQYDDLKDNLGEDIENAGGDSLDEPIGHDRNYHRQALGKFEENESFGDIEIEIRLTVLIQSAYYEGATLDYLIEVYNGYEYVEIEEGFYTNTTEDMVNDLFDLKYNEHSYSEMSKGLRVIQSRHAKNWLDKEIKTQSEKIEKILESYSEHKLQKVGGFSNGEAVYQEVN